MQSESLKQRNKKSKIWDVYYFVHGLTVCKAWVARGYSRKRAARDYEILCSVPTVLKCFLNSKQFSS